ncbi:MAG TPA: hypothetical protein VGK58_09295 [Lacipirellulaceae bacterium]
MNFLRRTTHFFCVAFVLSFVLFAGSQLLAGPIVDNQVPTITLQIENVPSSWSYTRLA